MRFADLGAALAAVLLAGWTGVLALLAPGPATTGRRLQRPAVLAGSGIAAVLLATQAGLVDAVEDRAGPAAWDGPVLAWLVAHRDAATSAVLTAVSAVGGTLGMAVLAVAGAALLWWRRRRAHAGLLVAAAAGAGVLSTGFKHLYGRARPPMADQLVPESTLALPSGHAVGSMVVLGMLAVLTVLLARTGVARAAAVAAATAGVLAIGISRLYLGVHWLTDVLTGWAVGGAWLAVCAAAAVLVERRSGAVPARRPPAVAAVAAPAP